MSWLGELIIRIEKATDLKAADIGGTSDPYVNVLITNNHADAKFRTTTKHKTLNPSWKQDFLYSLSDKIKGDITIELVVYDSDKLKDDFLGLYTLKISPDFKSMPLTTVDLKGKGSHKAKGNLTFSITYNKASSREALSFTKEKEYTFPKGKEIKLECGPILLFRGSDKGGYKIALLVVTPSDGSKPKLNILPAPVNDVNAKLLISRGDDNLWCYDFAVPQFETSYACQYSIGGKSFKFWVPASKETPRFVITSCSGFMHIPPWEINESNMKKMKLSHEKNFMWKRLIDEHEKKRYHILIQGGDQVYSDPFWEVVKEISHFKGLGDPRIVNFPVTDSIKDQIDAFYMRIYKESWKETWIKDALAQIPSVMMWDDHDIMDGWGSFDDANLQCPLIKDGAWKAAEKYFLGFQQGGTIEDVPGNLKGSFKGHHHMCIVNGVGIAAIDIRTERTKTVVMTEESYAAIFKWLNENSNNMDHLVLMSSIPIIYNDFAVLEKLIKGHGVGIEDDLLDHWRSQPHNTERVVFLNKLFDWAHKSSTRITVISGDVHIGAVGCAIHKEYSKESNAGVINAVISSAIVNHPPPNAAVKMLTYTAGHRDHADENITAGLCKFPPENKDYYIRDRNFVEMLGSEERGFLCNWISEDVNKYAKQHSWRVYIRPFQKGATTDIKMAKEPLPESINIHSKSKETKIKGWFH